MTLPDRRELERLDKSTLVDIVLQQAERIGELSARLAATDQRLEELERRAVRGAAPFARPENKRSGQPRRPGRERGHEGAFRVRPPDAAVDRRLEVALTHCPHCGAALSPATDEAVEQTLIEAPPVRAQVIRLITHRNVCRCCGDAVASTHPLQVSTAQGAAATHLGPRALALAAALNTGFGLTMRKTCAVLGELAGISLSPGGLAQALARTAGRLAADRAALLARLKAEPVLHTDETSWWVGGAGASLWVLTNRAGTFYHVASSRSRAEAAALIGDYDGVLVSDCLNIYDDLTPHQHKCYAHHLKEIGKALERPEARGSPYLRDLRGLLHAAMALKQVMADLAAADIVRMRHALDANAERLLAEPRTAPNACGDAAPLEEKLRQRLVKQRDHLFTFLDHAAVDATNNLAERQLRPAVISRKLSCGNKTEKGARTWQTLASLAATCRQNGASFAGFLIPRLVLDTEPAQGR
jgi:transposase